MSFRSKNPWVLVLKSLSLSFLAEGLKAKKTLTVWNWTIMQQSIFNVCELLTYNIHYIVQPNWQATVDRIHSLFWYHTKVNRVK